MGVHKYHLEDESCYEESCGIFPHHGGGQKQETKKGVASAGKGLAGSGKGSGSPKDLGGRLPLACCGAD